MSDKDEWLFRVEDILSARGQIENSASDHESAGSLHEDWESFRAVERNIQIIADASKNIPGQVKNEYDSVEWKKIINMQNLVVHEYDRVDYKIVWNAVQKEIPALKATLIGVLSKHGGADQT